MHSAVGRGLYAVAVAVLSLIIAPFFLLKARGRARLLERFGIWNLPRDTYVWFHGASMGEINGIVPVIRALRNAHPKHSILLTATSVTGLERAAGEVTQARLLPFDCQWLLRLALGRSDVKALVITETELWPAMIREAKTRGAHICLVNGIVSDYSIRWYRLFRPFVAPLLSNFDSIACASEVSRERLIELGAPANLTSVTGNTKYDLQPSVQDEAAALALKNRFFSESAYSVVVLGSLRPGEETLWFPELAASLATNPKLAVVIAPRHKEKFDFFAQRLDEFGIEFRRHSASSAGCDRTRVILLDTYGELEKVYSFAHTVFVGGSLVDWGGHNPLEAACYGAFLAMGPYARNVRAIVAELESCGALWRIDGPSAIRALLEEIRKAPADLAARGQAGRKVWQSHRGASEKIIARLESLMQ